MLEAQAAHAAGDALVAIALAGTLFFSVPTAEARGKVGLYLLLTMAPFAVLSPVIGPLLDRRAGGYRIAMALSAGGRAILALYMATRTDRLLLYPLAFGALVLSRTHGVSRGALVPEILPPGKRLVAANAQLSIASVLAGAIAAGPGIGLQRWLGPGATLRVAAAVFALGVVAALRVPPAKRAGPPKRPEEAGERLPAPRLVAGGLAAAAARTAVGFLTFLLAFLLQSRGEGGRGFAIVVAAAGVGGLVGSVVTPVLRWVLRESLLLLLALGGMGAMSLAASSGFGLRSAAIVAGVAGMAASAARLAFDSLVQQDAPHAVRARTFARYEAIFQLCWVGGAGLATAIPFGASPGLRVAAAICAGGIVLGIRRPAPSVRRSDPGRATPS